MARCIAGFTRRRWEYSCMKLIMPENRWFASSQNTKWPIYANQIDVGGWEATAAHERIYDV